MTRPTGWWENAADAMAWTPTAQLARAVTQAGTSPGAATAHLLAGLAVLPVLFVLHGRTFRLFLVATPGVGAASKRARRQRRPYPRWLPESPAWTVAVRSVRLKLREPRLLTGLVAALALAIGGSLAVVLSSGDGRNPTMVLLGTAAQFAVIFDNQNVFGTDGRALGADLIANGDLSHLVRGKRLAALFSGVPPVVVVPPMVAALTGGWSLVPIGLLLGAGAAVLASGVAMFVSVNADGPARILQSVCVSGRRAGLPVGPVSRFQPGVDGHRHDPAGAGDRVFRAGAACVGGGLGRRLPRR